MVLERDAKGNRNNIVGAVLITGILRGPTPLEFEYLNDFGRKRQAVVSCMRGKPDMITKRGFEKFRKLLQKRKVYGIKIFLGYYPYYATDSDTQDFTNLRH